MSWINYADALGIEMDSLHPDAGAHGARSAGPAWRACATRTTLLFGRGKTYALIEEMIVSASRPFATRRIHIGMDEAYGLGRGKYMDRHGYVPQSELMQKHLARIGDILKKHGLHAMMWSDMYFHMAQPGSTTKRIRRAARSARAIVAAAPKDIDLVYWDYYTEDGALARHLFAEHARFSADTLFAGGVYVERPRPRLRQGGSDDARFDDGVPRGRRSAGVRDDVWGDDGAECSPLLGGLLGLQLFAEIAYNGGRTTTRWTRDLKPARAAPRSPSARWARSTASGLTRGRAT